MPTIGDVLKAVGKLPPDPPAKKYWQRPAPKTCNACQGDLGSVFYDAYVGQMGCWAIVCHSCFRAYRCHVGTGGGQKYNAKTLEKLAG